MKKPLSNPATWYALIILLMAAGCLFSCHKNQLDYKPNVVVSYEGDQLYGYGTERKPSANPCGGRGKKPCPPDNPPPPDTTTDPPTDTTNYPPPNKDAVVILLDGDGYDYKGGYFDGAYYYLPAGINLDMNEVKAGHELQYAGYNIRFTLSEYEYSLANPYRRQRAVFTSSTNRTGSGYAYVGSGFWGPEMNQIEGPPVLIYAGNLQNYEYYNIEIGCHEVGHGLGLVHVHWWDINCFITQSYACGWVMGNGTCGNGSEWAPGHPCRWQGGAYGRSDDSVLSEYVGRL